MQKIISNESSKVTDEFVETEYYQDLNCVDKQHHTVLPLLCLATYSSPILLFLYYFHTSI